MTQASQRAADNETRIASLWGATLLLSRRRVLQTALGASALALTSGLLAACGGDDDEDSGGDGGDTSEPDPTATTAASDESEPTATTATETMGEPVSGGRLVVGYTEPPTMDPRVSGATIAWRLFYNLFDTLVVQEAETGEIVPGLATSWEISPDGLLFAFNLRDGVTFHDGTPFNAEAVKFTYDSILEPELKSLTAIGYLGPYESAVVVDDLTVEINFSEQYAPFLNNLSHSVLAPVSPTAVEEYGEDFGFNPVGTGPFMFREWNEQVSMVFEKNPDYNWPLAVYKHEGPAYLDEIEIKFIPEATTILGTLENGETDLIDGVPPQEVERLQNDEGYQVLLPSVPGSPQVLPLNATRFPTDDLLVRQAILYAVDMETIIDTLWFGSRRAAQGPLSSPTWSYNPAVEEMYPYDTDRATELLEEAGWEMGSGGVLEKDGERMHLEYITTSGIQGQAGELVQAYLAAVGIEVNLQQLEYAATAAAYLASEHNIARIYFSHTDPVVLTTLYHSVNIMGTNFNRTMKEDATLDEMLSDATSELDPEVRRQMYEDIQAYIMEQALIIPLWEETVFWGANASVHGLHFQPLGGVWFYDVWKDA